MSPSSVYVLLLGELVEEWETMETNISFNPRYLMVGNMRLTSLKAKGKLVISTRATGIPLLS